MERQDPQDEYVGDVGADGCERAAVSGLPDWRGAVEAEEAGQGVRGKGYGSVGEGRARCWWGWSDAAHGA